MIGFIGGGNMAEALIKGMAKRGMRGIIVSEPREERRRYFETAFGIKATPSNLEVVRESGIIILSVKPQIIKEVLDEIGGTVTGDKTVVSIAAGITLDYLQSKLKTKKLVRVMPNVGAFAGEAMSVLSLCECFEDADVRVVRDIFMSVGKVLTLPEKYINSVTALSGSGPAFIALFIEAMTEAGVKLGLAEDEALELAVQTIIGTARLLEDGMAPAKLREMVTSPGGTTAAGLRVFEEKGLKSLVEEALRAAHKRAGELAR